VTIEALQLFIKHPGLQGKLLDLRGRGMDAEREWVECNNSGANNGRKARTEVRGKGR